MAAPLPLFPAASQAFFESGRKGLDDDLSLAKARQKWLGSDYVRAEADDPYHQLCYAGREPLDDDFAGLAAPFFAPLTEWQLK
jgi:exonuclease V gamma subunit